MAEKMSLLDPELTELEFIIKNHSGFVESLDYPPGAIDRIRPEDAVCQTCGGFTSAVIIHVWNGAASCMRTCEGEPFGRASECMCKDGGINRDM